LARQLFKLFSLNSILQIMATLIAVFRTLFFWEKCYWNLSVEVQKWKKCHPHLIP